MPKTGTSFKRGRQKTGGREKGTPNRTTTEARTLCRNLVSDEEYQHRFRDRFVKGQLPSHLESMVWQYAYGKPRQEEPTVDGDEGPSELRITVVDKRKVKPLREVERLNSE